MSTIMPPTPHERLGFARRKLGKSQTVMAQLLGVSLRGYQNYERGEREIPLHALDDARERIGLNPDWIREGEGEMFVSTRKTVPAPDFFTDSEGTRTDDERSERAPATEQARFAASRAVTEVLKAADLQPGIGLRAVLRDLVLWYGVPEETLGEVVAAVREEIERAKREATE